MALPDECHVVQQVHFVRAGLPPSLYVDTVLEPEDGALCAGPSNPSQVLEEGARLSTESYFNSFYLSYWREFTDVRRLGVRVSFRGRLWVGVCLRDDGEDRRLLVSTIQGEGDADGSSKPGQTTIWLDDVTGGMAELSAGRLFVEIEALARSEIHDIAYVSDAPPLRNVTLSVGICTFNRETFLADTLTELRAALQRNDAIKRVYVVNQGARFDTPILGDIFRDERFSLIEQGNLGGCGGFNRSMLETLRGAEACTHHLLMDDDVVLDGRVIDTAISYLRYARRDIVLGGHMLDASRPATLYEAGAVFDPFWFIVSIGKGVELRRPEELDLFNRYRRVDYNAWWFCILPVNEIAAAQFSPPIFIRGDDIEYGCRLAKRGVPTVALPGVAVWHELFFSKIEWQQYYDIRNRLILSAVHGDLTPQPATHFVFGYILECLLTHRYRAAVMCMAGISDFLLGPDRLFAVDPAERHRRVMSLGANMMHKSLEKTQARSLPWGEVVDRPKSVADSAGPYIRRFVSVLFLPYETRCLKLFRYSNVHPVAVGNAAYVMTDARADTFVLHTPKRLRMLAILARAVFVIARFGIWRNAANAKWVSRIGHYQTSAAWQALFGLDRDQPKSPGSVD